MIWRRNADPRVRGLERAVASGDTSAIPALISSRIRLGEVQRVRARDAKILSAPMTKPGSSEGSYDWHPLDWGHGEIPAPPSEFLQDPRTLILHQALVDLLGPRMRLPTNTTSRTDQWMWSRGFFVADTGRDAAHAPFEVQSDDNVERDTEDQENRAANRQYEIARQHAEATGADVGEVVRVGDDVFMWYVRQQAFQGNANALNVLKYLRFNSTVEYCNVLGANVYDRDPGPGNFGVTEYRLVSTLLGGDPL